MRDQTLEVVVDSNALQSDDLRLFLAASGAHKAVLTDYAWMEAYKGNSVESITKSMAVLCEFPSQVVILKGTKEVGALDARAPGVAKRMIWPKSHGEFQKTAEGLRQAQLGDLRTIAQIVRHGKAADEQMQKVLSDASVLLPVFADLMTLFTDDEIAIIRKRSGTLDIGRKFLIIADQLFRNLVSGHPGRPRNPSHNSKINTFLYRYSLAGTIYLLEWIRHGGQMGTRPERIRNDLVDLNFAVFGTYFDGLMTADSRLLNLYIGLRVFLKKLGARMRPEFVDVLAGTP